MTKRTNADEVAAQPIVPAIMTSEEAFAACSRLMKKAAPRITSVPKVHDWGRDGEAYFAWNENGPNYDSSLNHPLLMDGDQPVHAACIVDLKSRRAQAIAGNSDLFSNASVDFY